MAKGSKRRAPGDGNISTRSDGRLIIRVTLASGAVVTKYARTKEDAERIRQKLLVERAQGLLARTGRQSFAQYRLEWLTRKTPNLKPHSVEMYAWHLGLLLPAIGPIEIGQLGPAHIQDAYQALQQTHSGTTVNTLHAILLSALDDAVRLDLIRRNPCDRVQAPRKDTKQMQVLTPEQAQRLLSETRDARYGPLWRLLLSTGMRIGEALALHWRDVEDGRADIHATVSSTRELGRFLQTPKSAHAVRLVPLTLDVQAALARLRTSQVQEHGWEAWQDRLIWTTRSGGISDHSNCGAYLKADLERLELPRVRIHDLRHTAASIMLQRGVPVHVVSRILGHAAPSITLNVYSHLMPGQQEAAVEALGEALGGQ